MAFRCSKEEGRCGSQPPAPISAATRYTLCVGTRVLSRQDLFKMLYSHGYYCAGVIPEILKAVHEMSSCVRQIDAFIMGPSVLFPKAIK